jgi:hypothetical protein
MDTHTPSPHDPGPEKARSASTRRGGDDDIFAFEENEAHAPRHPAEFLQSLPEQAASRTTAPAAPTPTPPAGPAVPATAPDSIDSLLSRPVISTTETSAGNDRRPPLSLKEKAALAVCALALAAAATWYTSTLIASRPKEARTPSRPWPELPISGDLVRITEASAAWRHTKETDRVGRIEVPFPTPGERSPVIIPEVNFTIAPDGGKSGYLRFLFIDPDGRESGDVRVIRVTSGKLESMNRGEIIAGPDRGSVYASLGFLDEPSFFSYTAKQSRRWRIEIAESSRYDAPDRDWKLLSVFDVRNTLLD